MSDTDIPAYYNENDPKAAAWLRELIRAGRIAPGDVDERSIKEVEPKDVAGYVQCHFFAGIGVWSYSLRAAGWPDDLAVWTGSCPCQSFSASGKRGGFGDQRHLWPAWFRLIRERRPERVFGEQVASKDGLAWLDVVSADLEGAGYGRRIYAQRASGRRTSGSGCTSWPSPNAGPQNDGDSNWETRRANLKAQHRNGNGFGMTLGMAATLASWAPPRSAEKGHSTGNPERAMDRKARIEDQVHLTSWATPQGRDSKSASIQKTEGELWGTKGRPLEIQAALTDSGPTPSGSPAATGSGGQLNPAFPRWLMGLPPAWCDCAVTAMQSLPRSRKASLKPTSKSRGDRNRA